MKITSTLFFSLVLLSFARAQSPFDYEQLKLADQLQFEFNKARDFSHEPQLSITTPQKLLNFDDLDNDGMTDIWETAQGFNSTDPNDAFGDADNDHVLNLFEFQLSADPHSSVSPTVVNVSLTDSLVGAINAAAPNTVLRLQSGTFLLNYTFFGEKKLMLQGGWNATFTERQPLLTPTIFDGQWLDEVFYLSAPTIVPSAVNTAIVLDGLHIKRGKGTFGNLNFITRKGEYRLSVKDCFISNTDTITPRAVNISHWDSTSLADVSIINTAIVSNPNASGIYSQNTEGSKVRWRIINCTISNNNGTSASVGHGYDGFTLEEATQKNIKIVNSIISGNANVDIQFRRHIVIDASYSNIDSVNSAPYTPASGTIFNAGAGMINQNAMFADSAALDYHLLPGSPCLDSGSDVGLPYLGVAPDMGAFEGFGTSAAPASDIKIAIHIFPNPAHNELHVELPEYVSSNGNAPIFYLTNALGQEVLRQYLQVGTTTIPCKHLASGWYAYSIGSENSAISKGKVLILKE